MTEEIDEAGLAASTEPSGTRLGQQLGRLAKQSAIYGLGGLVSRILALVLLPLYTAYLANGAYGRVEVLIAWQAVAVILLRAGLSTAFFRFYFDEETDEGRTRVVRTSFWFTMTMATAGLVLGLVFAHPFSVALGGMGDSLVRATFVGIWAQMNYEQLTSLFRVEQRALAFGLASLANVLVTIGASFLLIVVYHKGPVGLIVGNFVGTLAIYLVLLGYRRYQLGLQFDRHLLREMNRFGMPLVPSALALWAINFMDRFLVVWLKGKGPTGDYSLAVRVSSGITFLLFAFRTAWPAYAYSIKDDREARHTYGFVLTYLVYLTSWCALGLGVLAPWIVRILAGGGKWHPRDREIAASSIAPLAFSLVAYGAYTVVAIGVGRARKTQFNWVITSAAAALNIGLVLLLVPALGIFGAALASLAAYAAMFLGMIWNAQRVYPVRYQWRRIATLAAAAGALTIAGRLLRGPLALELALALAFPLVLFPLGFYLPGERARLGALLRR